MKYIKIYGKTYTKNPYVSVIKQSESLEAHEQINSQENNKRRGPKVGKRNRGSVGKKI